MTSISSWTGDRSPLPLLSSSMPNMSQIRYDRSLIVPLKLKAREKRTHGSTSFLTRESTIREEKEKDLVKPIFLIEEEEKIFRTKLDRIRINLAQTLQSNRHNADKIQHKKVQIQQMINERNESIEEIFNVTSELNGKIEDLRNEILHQRHQRDVQQMHQMRLRRTLKQLEKIENHPPTEDRRKLIDEYENRLAKLRKEFQKEINASDEQIRELKENLADEFYFQSDEYKKMLSATRHAFDIENQKRNLLKTFVDEYERNVYRAMKPCCLATSMRFNHISTRYRLYSMIEIALNELLQSSYACGQFARSYETFRRLHTK